MRHRRRDWLAVTGLSITPLLFCRCIYRLARPAENVYEIYLSAWSGIDVTVSCYWSIRAFNRCPITFLIGIWECEQSVSATPIFRANRNLQQKTHNPYKKLEDKTLPKWLCLNPTYWIILNNWRRSSGTEKFVKYTDKRFIFYIRQLYWCFEPLRVWRFLVS